ncbi:unnamed protein product [Notodromas monacha]|uniref:Uncharacterized protein n=1 Tax=Notodromas monacha TaxID=399045 RepID=A0A7R9G8U6_9CRUS|nr:unnamed protein product [Notodromas monacha]CAG0912468.1 unnamed protein product [Notodromas monacha]
MYLPIKACVSCIIEIVSGLIRRSADAMWAEALFSIPTTAKVQQQWPMVFAKIGYLNTTKPDEPSSSSELTPCIKLPLGFSAYSFAVSRNRLVQANNTCSSATISIGIVFTTRAMNPSTPWPSTMMPTTSGYRTMSSASSISTRGNSMSTNPQMTWGTSVFSTNTVSVGTSANLVTSPKSSTEWSPKTNGMTLTNTQQPLTSPISTTDMFRGSSSAMNTQGTLFTTSYLPLTAVLTSSTSSQASLTPVRRPDTNAGETGSQRDITTTQSPFTTTGNPSTAPAKSTPVLTSQETSYTSYAPSTTSSSDSLTSKMSMVPSSTLTFAFSSSSPASFTMVPTSQTAMPSSRFSTSSSSEASVTSNPLPTMMGTSASSGTPPAGPSTTWSMKTIPDSLTSKGPMSSSTASVNSTPFSMTTMTPAKSDNVTNEVKETSSKSQSSTVNVPTTAETRMSFLTSSSRHHQSSVTDAQVTQSSTVDMTIRSSTQSSVMLGTNSTFPGSPVATNKESVTVEASSTKASIGTRPIEISTATGKLTEGGLFSSTDGKAYGSSSGSSFTTPGPTMSSSLQQQSQTQLGTGQNVSKAGEGMMATSTSPSSTSQNSRGTAFIQPATQAQQSSPGSSAAPFSTKSDPSMPATASSTSSAATKPALMNTSIPMQTSEIEDFGNDQSQSEVERIGRESMGMRLFGHAARDAVETSISLKESLPEYHMSRLQDHEGNVESDPAAGHLQLEEQSIDWSMRDPVAVEEVDQNKQYQPQQQPMVNASSQQSQNQVQSMSQNISSTTSNRGAATTLSSSGTTSQLILTAISNPALISVTDMTSSAIKLIKEPEMTTAATPSGEKIPSKAGSLVIESFEDNPANPEVSSDNQRDLTSESYFGRIKSSLYDSGRKTLEGLSRFSPMSLLETFDAHDEEELADANSY